MSIKSFLRWFVGDADAPLGPESERGLFNHFNRPESLPWPPADGPIVGNRPKQFRPPVSDVSEKDYQWDSSAAYYEEERRKHVKWLNDTFRPAVPKPVAPIDLVPCPAMKCGTGHGFCGLCGTAGEVTRDIADDYMRSHSVPTGKAALVDGEYKPTFRELKPTVGYFTDASGPIAPPRQVPYAVRPRVVAAALDNPNIPMEVHEYIVHLETHFARLAHHGE